VYQNTVPKAKNTAAATRATGAMRRRPSSHQQIATSMAASTVKIVWSSVERPKIATNGTRITAGSGGNGMSARRKASLEATGRTS